MFAIDFKHFRMEGNTFEALQWWLPSILGIFEWMRTLMKLSDGVCYWVQAFPEEWKHFWSFRMRFAIDFKRFRMNDYTLEAFGWCLLSILKRFRMEGNTFEAFGWWILSILSVFGSMKKILKLSHGVCYPF